MNTIQKIIVSVALVIEVLLLLEALNTWYPEGIYRAMLGVAVVAIILYTLWEKKGKTK